MIISRFVLSDGYYKELFKKVRSVSQPQILKRIFSGSVVLISTLVLAFLLDSAIHLKKWSQVPILVLLIIFLLFWGYIYKYVQLSRIRRDRHFGKSCDVSFEVEGITMGLEGIQSRILWSEFEKARFFDDGLLLSISKGSHIWISSSSIVEGDFASLVELASQGIKDCQ